MPQAKEFAAAVEQKKAPGFSKIDFCALVQSKGLTTKAAAIAYVQEIGPAAAQTFMCKQQRRLTEYIEDAYEWSNAKAAAEAEKMSDWEVLCQAAKAPCSCGPGECPYAMAVNEVFARNSGTLSPHKLASALRSVITAGPNKTCKVPFLVGPSNTGKSTLLYPFDELFGHKHVFHKPALGSTFALRNITKGKRFIFWDDYRPVEFAHEKTVPVATFLSLFIGKETEVQVSQSFNDGNLDVRWSRGVVFTAKEDGLWTPTSRVSDEDVRHLRNRVEEFRFTHVVPHLKAVEPCAPCMAHWIRKYSDEAPPVAPAPALTTSAAALLPLSPLNPFDAVAGFERKMTAAKLDGPIANALYNDVVAIGAVDVSELTLSDWQGLPSWKKLLPLQARRLSTCGLGEKQSRMITGPWA